MPFTLTRTGDAKIATVAGGPRLGNELVGSWDGTLDVKGTLVRLTLTMANRPDGTSAASIRQCRSGAGDSGERDHAGGLERHARGQEHQRVVHRLGE